MITVSFQKAYTVNIELPDDVARTVEELEAWANGHGINLDYLIARGQGHMDGEPTWRVTNSGLPHKKRRGRPPKKNK